MKYCPKCFKKYPLSTEKCPEDGSYLVAPMDKDLVGEVLDDRYTIMERVGKGGMGVVYKAEQHLIKRIVALKVLRREIVQDESAVKRFLNEARAIATLDSKHTITLHDFGVTRDGLLYYTMELLKGRPLSVIIQDEAPLEHVRAAGLLLQACRSLEEAHEHNILHRDLKPENLFVSMKKGKEQLKVLDFGIAKLVGDSSMDTVTQAGMIVGTPQYLSPEQAKGKPVAQTSDLYSLGIVLYEMLAGEPPFMGETPMATLWAHIQDPVPPLTQKNPNVQVPRSIEAFLARALEKEPSDRFQSAAAFSDALRRAVEDHEASPETVTLPPLSTTDQGLRFQTPIREVEAVPAPAEEPDVAEVGVDDVDVDDVVDERGTVLLGGAVEPSSPKAEPPREDFEEVPTSSHAGVEAKETPEELGSAETAWATEVPEGAAHAPASTPLPEVPVLEPESKEPEAEEPVPLPSEPVMAPPMGDGGEVADRAGARTLSLIFPKRNYIVWGGGGLALLVVVVVVALWAPWDRVDTSPDGKPVVAGAPDDLALTSSGQSDTMTPSPVVDVHVVDIAEDISTRPEILTDTSAVQESPAGEVTASTGVPTVEAGVTPTLDVVPPPADFAKDQVTPPADRVTGPEVEATSPVVDVHADAGEATPVESAVDDGARKRAEEGERLAAEREKEREAEERKEATRRAEAKAKEKAEEEAKRKAEEASRRKDKKKTVSKVSQLISKARREMRKKRFEVALKRLNDAAAAEGETSEVRTLRRKCYDGIKAQEVSKHLAQAKAALGRKDFDACIRAAGMATKLDSGNSASASLLKECQEKKAIGETHF